MRAVILAALVGAAYTLTIKGLPCADDVTALLNGDVEGSVAKWSADAALQRPGRACVDAKALLGIAFARSNRLDRGVALLREALRERPDDWVAGSYLGAAYELMARKIAAHIGSGEVVDGRNAVGTPPKPASEGYLAALRSAIAHLERAVAGQLQWVRRNKKKPSDGSATPVTAAAAAGLPQAALAQPLTMLFRSLGTCLLWAGRETHAREVFAAGAQAVGWPSPWSRPTVPHAQWAGAVALGPVHGLPRSEYPGAAGAALAADRGSHRDTDRGPLSPLLEAFEAELLPVARVELVALLLRQEEAAAVAGGAEKAPPPPGGWGGAAGADRLLSPAAGFQAEEAGLHEGRQWRVLRLAVNARPDAAGCATMPRTCAFLAAEPLAQVADGQAKVSALLPPGARIKPHAGPSDARLRVHCTLAVANEARAGVAELRVGDPGRPGGAWVPWRPGRCFAFDEASEHEVRMRGGSSSGSRSSSSGSNSSSSSGLSLAASLADPSAWPFRAVLIVDIANPFVEPLAAFRRDAVAPGAWAAHGGALVAAWRAVREWGPEGPGRGVEL